MSSRFPLNVLENDLLRLLKSIQEADRITENKLKKTCGDTLSLGLKTYLNFLDDYGYVERDKQSYVLTGVATDELNGQAKNLREDVQEGLKDRIGERLSGHFKAKGGNLAERYKRHDQIGKGGIGTVYRGTHLPLGRDVAIKEIKEIFTLFGDLQRDDIVSNFKEVVQGHARLVHPGIIQILDVDIDTEYPYFVMEYAPRGSLRKLLDGGKTLPLSVRLKIFLQIAQALRYAHGQNAVHTDLKPENVLFDSDGNAKLVDFGIGRVIERDTAQQIYIGVGTVAYLSPEQFRNPADATVQSDIYSLGIMFYEMLTGKLPGRRSPMPSSFFPDIPRKLDDIFDNMCMDAEEDRYDSIQDMLDEFLASEEVVALLDPRQLLDGGAPADATPAPAYTPDPEPQEDAPEPESEPEPEPHDEEDASEPEPEPDNDDAEADDGADEAQDEAADNDDGAGDGDDDDDDDEEDDDILAKLDKYGKNF